jgi:hypothetical protein
VTDRKPLAAALDARAKVEARIYAIDRMRDSPSADLKRLEHEVAPLRQQLNDLIAARESSSDFEIAVAELSGKTSDIERLERQVVGLDKDITIKKRQLAALDSEIQRIRATDLHRATVAIDSAIDAALAPEAQRLIDEVRAAWATIFRNRMALAGMELLALAGDLQAFPHDETDAWWASVAIETDFTLGERYSRLRAALATDADAQLPSDVANPEWYPVRPPDIYARRAVPGEKQAA